MLGTPTIYFDCDSTLVMWEMDGSPNALPFELYGKKYLLVPHQKHIDKLKEHKREGFTIIVWSAGGAEWSKEVVKVLGLENYVDLMISKPCYYYDDLISPKFLHEHKRIYYPFGSDWMETTNLDDEDLQRMLPGGS